MKIIDDVTGEPLFDLPGERMNILTGRTGAIVYIVSYKREVVYVGVSSRGLMRPFGKDHHAIGYIQWDDDFEVRIISFRNVKDALQYEQVTINRLLPLLNAGVRRKSFILSAQDVFFLSNKNVVTTQEPESRVPKKKPKEKFRGRRGKRALRYLVDNNLFSSWDVKDLESASRIRNFKSRGKS